MTLNRLAPRILERKLPSSVRILTTDPGLDAPLTRLYVLYALPHFPPKIPGEWSVLLEWMQRGTRTRSRIQMFQDFGRYGIEPHCTISDHVAVMSIQCLDACRDAALELLQDLIYRPAFEDTSLDDILDELDEDDQAMMDDPDEITARARRWGRWHGSTLAYPVDGTMQTRASLSATYLRSLHEQLFTRPSCIAIASAQAEAWVDATHRMLCDNRPQKANPIQAPRFDQLNCTPQNITVHVPTMEHAVVGQYALGPPNTSPEELALATLHHHALTDGMSAPWMTYLRGERALSYAVSSSLIRRGTLIDHYIEIEPSPDRILEAIHAAHTLWMDPDTVQPNDIERAKTGIDTDWKMQNMDASRALITALSNEVIPHLPLGYYDRLYDYILHHVNGVGDVHRRYGLSRPPLCTIIVGPCDRMNASLQAHVMDVSTLFGIPDEK